MAYRLDSYDNALVIDGWEAGVADNPFGGIADMRNVNVISIPGEASVNFATSVIGQPIISGTKTVTGLSSDAISFAAITNLENGMAIQFAGVGSLTGVSLNTTYWVYSSAGSPVTSCKLYATYSSFGSHTGAVTIGGTAGGATFTVYNIGGNSPSSGSNPKSFAYMNTNGKTAMQDGIGQCWSNLYTTASGYWTYMGLSGTSDSTGRGLAFYSSTKNQYGYLFSFLNQSIDYFNLTTGAWVYGWKPSDASTHNSGYLKAIGVHEAMVMPTNQLIYCDGQYVGRFYETNPATDFDPANLTTYTPDNTQLLPGFDSAQSLAYLGSNILVGGNSSIIYPWNGTATTFNYPILLPEAGVTKMLTVNTNTYIFVGNRGRIYVTNGTGATLFKKLPDHISGTVEPYYTWGGVCSIKNQLYFSALVTTNAGTSISQYGGVWAIDLDTKSLRLTNKLSYATYAGFASALIPNFASTPAGTGLYIGWNDGTNANFGIDTTSSSPYTGSQATIDSDLIPIGTFTKPRDFTKVEYRLVRPLVSGESISIKTRLIFNTQNTGYSQTFTDSTVGNYSGSGDVNFANAQWVQFQIVLNSTASSPSYVRLKEIRILGLTGPTLAQSQTLSI